MSGRDPEHWEHRFSGTVTAPGAITTPQGFENPFLAKMVFSGVDIG